MPAASRERTRMRASVTMARGSRPGDMDDHTGRLRPPAGARVNTRAATITGVRSRHSGQDRLADQWDPRSGGAAVADEDIPVQDLRTDRATPARMYDYYLGGKDHFAADR